MCVHMLCFGAPMQVRVVSTTPRTGSGGGRNCPIEQSDAGGSAPLSSSLSIRPASAHIRSKAGSRPTSAVAHARLRPQSASVRLSDGGGANGFAAAVGREFGGVS